MPCAAAPSPIFLPKFANPNLQAAPLEHAARLHAPRLAAADQAIANHRPTRPPSGPPSAALHWTVAACTPSALAGAGAGAFGALVLALVLLASVALARTPAPADDDMDDMLTWTPHFSSPRVMHIANMFDSCGISI